MAPLHEIICRRFSFAVEFCARSRLTPRAPLATLIRGSAVPPARAELSCGSLVLQSDTRLPSLYSPREPSADSNLRILDKLFTMEHKLAEEMLFICS